MTRPRDLAYRSARSDATIRHNAELRHHAGRPQSYGSGIGVICGCGQKYNLDGWRDHLIAVCILTPVPSH